jgi:hypothetical protein
MLVAAGLWLVSVALFMGSITALEMVSLSHVYAAARSGAERAQYLVAGQTMLAVYMGQGSSFVTGYVLASVAGVLAGIGMLRNRVFSREAALAVIVAKRGRARSVRPGHRGAALDPVGTDPHRLVPAHRLAAGAAA